EKAMQTIRVEAAQSLDFRLGAEKKGGIAAQAEVARHRRTRPIRADEEARPHAAIRQFDAGLAATCPAEGRAVAQLSACLAGLAREPCHEARGIRSQEVVARRRQIDEGKRRTIEPYAPDAARESWRRLPALGYLLDQEPGGANAVACCPPPLEHDRAQPAQR